MKTSCLTGNWFSPSPNQRSHEVRLKEEKRIPSGLRGWHISISSDYCKAGPSRLLQKRGESMIPNGDSAKFAEFTRPREFLFRPPWRDCLNHPHPPMGLWKSGEWYPDVPYMITQSSTSLPPLQHPGERREEDVAIVQDSHQIKD